MKYYHYLHNKTNTLFRYGKVANSYKREFYEDREWKTMPRQMWTKHLPDDKKIYRYLETKEEVQLNMLFL
jgi:hypothetical protein